jgi:type VI secretion system protein ImpH
MADLISILEQDSRRFSFFQAVSLLESYMREHGGAAAALRTGRIRFRADPSITFAPSDISGFRYDRDIATVICSFMGLLGVSSPLPNYFSDFVSRYSEDAAALSDFCGLFNQRIYTLFYEAYAKYRFVNASFTKIFLDRLLCLAGMQGAGEGYRRLAYSGSLAGRRRSAADLGAMVSHFFGGIPVFVRQWVGRWTPLASRTQLGRDSRLGENTSIGTHTFDVAGKFRVVIGPLQRETFEAFAEGCENLTMLRALVSSFVADPLEFDIEVRLERTQLLPAVLGKADAPLGRISSLGQAAAGTCAPVYSAVFSGSA